MGFQGQINFSRPDQSKLTPSHLCEAKTCYSAPPLRRKPKGPGQANLPGANLPSGGGLVWVSPPFAATTPTEKTEKEGKMKMKKMKKMGFSRPGDE